MSDELYLNQIQQLVELQKVDDKIFDLDQELKNAPLNLEEMEEKFHALENRRNHSLDKKTHLEEQKKRLTLEIDEDSARLRKSKNKLMMVENSREHQAMVREMDALEKMSRTREEEKVAILEALQLQTEEFDKIENEYVKLKADLEEKRASLGETLQLAKDKLHKLQADRQIFSRDIPQPVFLRYEFIRKRLEHPVIVAVEDGVCTGCHIAIPPQDYIELQTGQQILSCPNCQRLIFWNEHFSSPDQKRIRPAPVELDEDEVEEMEEENEEINEEEDFLEEFSEDDDEDEKD